MGGLQNGGRATATTHPFQYRPDAGHNYDLSNQQGARSGSIKGLKSGRQAGRRWPWATTAAGGGGRRSLAAKQFAAGAALLPCLHPVFRVENALARAAAGRHGSSRTPAGTGTAPEDEPQLLQVRGRAAEAREVARLRVRQRESCAGAAPRAPPTPPCVGLPQHRIRCKHPGLDRSGANYQSVFQSLLHGGMMQACASTKGSCGRRCHGSPRLICTLVPATSAPALATMQQVDAAPVQAARGARAHVSRAAASQQACATLVARWSSRARCRPP